MGRDQAYPGIFARKVITDFSKKLYCTENAISYLELDWDKGIVKNV